MLDGSKMFSSLQAYQSLKEEVVVECHRGIVKE
jgi:hypothetical protein